MKSNRSEGLPEAALASDRKSMELVWRKRAAQLAQRPVATAAGQEARQVMVVTVAEERYGLDLTDVVAVLPLVHLTPVPGAPPVFSGVVNVHGEIRPVAGLKRLLGIPGEESEGLARVIVLRNRLREVGLKVDRVNEIRWIGAGELQPPDEGRPGLPGRCCLGVTRDMLILLSAETLFAEILKGTIS